MKFSVNTQIFEKWPEIKIGVLVLTGINNKGHNEEILKLLRAEETKQKSLLATKEIGELSEVAACRKIYKEFGSNPHDFKSSVEALLRRVKNGKELPQINNLVDLYNFISIKYNITAGAEDLDKVKGDIELTFSDGTVKGKYLGSDVVETCDKGEVIYKDEIGFICRKWNWREADRTKIEDSTQNAVLVLENASVELHDDLEKVLDETSELVKKYLGGRAERFILSKDNLSLETSFTTGRKSNLDIEADFAPKEHQKIFKKQEKPIVKKRLPPQGSLALSLIEMIYATVTSLYPDIMIGLHDVSIEHPEEESYGDYSTNIAMKLTKEFHKSPSDIAEEIVKHIPKSSFIEKAEVVKPGFINLWLSKDYLSNQISEVLKCGIDYGKNKAKSGKKVVVEYTDPNPFKELHIGHLISNAIGESFARLMEACGADVWRADYFGDVGVHAAKSVWGIKKKMKEDNVTLLDLAKLTLKEKVKYMGEGYALGSRLYEEDNQAKEEISRLNTVLYIVAQRMWKEQGEKATINYDPNGKYTEQEITDVYDIYKTGRKWSLDYFESVYKILGTKFNGYYPESRVAETGFKYVQENIGSVFEKSDGAVIFEGEKFGLHTRVFINKNNLPTYEAKELGLAPIKYKDFPYDESIIVVGKEIREYFQVLIEALKQINPKLGNVTTPICTGMVNVPAGKMSSRKGNVITVLDIIHKLQDMAKEKMEKSDLTTDEKEMVSEQIAVAAIKYAFLKPSIGQDIVFDFEKSVSFEGDSGPYIQYTFVRTQSVLRKSETEKKGLWSRFAPSHDNYNDEELSLLRTIYQFPEVVAKAAENLSPNYIATFLFDLAQKYNNFYNKHSILNAESDDLKYLRLALTKATATVLENGLKLLGISAPEKM